MKTRLSNLHSGTSFPPLAGLAKPEPAPSQQFGGWKNEIISEFLQSQMKNRLETLWPYWQSASAFFTRATTGEAGQPLHQLSGTIDFLKGQILIQRNAETVAMIREAIQILTDYQNRPTPAGQLQIFA